MLARHFRLPYLLASRVNGVNLHSHDLKCNRLSVPAKTPPYLACVSPRFSHILAFTFVYYLYLSRVYI
jgi:hypothetical protein